MSIYKNGERYDVEITPSGMSIDPSWDDIKDKPDFKPVATSGDYNDLENKPVIPSVGNGTVTINQGGTQKGQFTLNQSGNTTIELDEGGVTEWDDIENKPEFKPVATSGSYNDLDDKPAIPSIEGLASEQWVKNQGYLTKHRDISGKVDRAELARVATSGSYDDLSNKPDLSDVVRLSTTGGQMGFWVSTGGFTIDSDNKNIDFTRSELKLNTPLWIRLSQSINLADGWTATLRGDETTKKRLIYNYRNDTANNIQIPQYRTIGLILTNPGSASHYIFSIGWTPTDINTTPSTVEWDNIQGKPDFKPVATSGSYNDLTNKPTIPSVGNGTITINQGGSRKGQFTLNQGGNAVINLEDGGTSETWTFTLSDGSTVNKNIIVK